MWRPDECIYNSCYICICEYCCKPYFTYKREKDISILSLSVGVLAVASWLIFDNMLYQYIFKIYYIDGILGYLVIMLAPAFFDHYLNREQEYRYCRLYTVSIVVVILNFIVFTTLHFTGVVDFTVLVYQ